MRAVLRLYDGVASEPRDWDEACQMAHGLAALERFRAEARHTALVGDQLFTDVLGANCAGLISILVTPLSPGRHAHTRAARRIERWVLSGGGHGRPVDR